MTVIDSHLHFWSIERGDYDWLTPDMDILYRDFLPSDFEPLRQKYDLAGTIVVQAAETRAETDFLLGLASANAWILGVIGWVDLASTDAAVQIGSLAQHAKFVGLRPMLQDMQNRSWILGEACVDALRTIAQNELVFDALIRPDQILHIAELADRFPALQIVVDHAAKPAFSSPDIALWCKQIAALGARPNVVCKLSGFVNEAPSTASMATFEPVFETLYEAFGYDRLLWGGDWPILDLAGGYGRWIDITRGLLAGLPARHSAAIMGLNAMRIYKVVAP